MDTTSNNSLIKSISTLFWHLTSPGSLVGLPLRRPLGAHFGFHSGIPRGPALASTPAFPGGLLWLPLRRPPGARFKVQPSTCQFLAFAGHLPTPQWLHSNGRGGVKIGAEMSPRASFQLSFQLPQGARFGFHFGVPRGPGLASTPVSPGGPVGLPLCRPPGAWFSFHIGIPRVPALGLISTSPRGPL